MTTFAGKWLVVWEQKASHDESWGASRYNFVSADGTVKFEPMFGTRACLRWRQAGGRRLGRERARRLPRGRLGPFPQRRQRRADPARRDPRATFEISGAVEQQRAPTVAFDGLDFLVVWEDMRNAEDYFDKRTDLYGARVSVSGTVLDPLGVAVATDAAPEQQPALASAAGDTLLAASIFRDEPGLTSYRLGLFHATGTFTDPPDAWFGGTPTVGLLAAGGGLHGPVRSATSPRGSGISGTAAAPRSRIRATSTRRRASTR